MIAYTIEDDSPRVISNTPKEIGSGVGEMITFSDPVIRAQDFREGLEICLTLKDALVLLPRDRALTDAYNALAYWLKDNLGITLTIKSQKTK